MLGLRRVKWALRKVAVPVRGDGLVLDVGSGGKPYPRSDILFDRVAGAEHRGGVPMMIDRPTVFGDGHKMPFKDKAFDFVIASHILEHMRNPEAFLSELQRVGKAGYIETPNMLFERLAPFKIHCLEVVSLNGVLNIYKKRRPVEDAFLGKLSFLESDPHWKAFFIEAPDMFHVRHYWKDSIKFTIHNPDVSCEWIENIYEASDSRGTKESYLDGSCGWREIGLKLLGSWHSYWRSSRMAKVNLQSILACPECKGALHQSKKTLRCVVCNLQFSADPVPDFTTLIR